MQLTQTKSYAGPIPSAEDLQKYNNIQEGFADRIITMAEKEQNERHELEKESSRKILEIERRKINIIRNGRWFALLAIMMILGFSTYIAFLGDTTASAWVVVGVLATIVAAFLGIKKAK